MGGLVKDMQDIFANADPGSSFGKSLQRAIVQAEKRLNSAEGLLGKDFFSEADLAKTLKQMDGIADILSEIHILAKGASTKALGFETQELIDSTKALKDFKAQVQDLKKNTKIGAISGMVDKDSIKQMAALSKTTGFSAGKTFDENYSSLTKSLDNVSKEYIEVQLEAQKAKEAMEAANLAAAEAKVNLNMAQGRLDSRKQANVNVAQAVAGISTGVGGASHRTKQNIIEDYQRLLDQQLVNNQWASGGEDFAHIIAGWLEVDEGDLVGTATQIVTNLKRSIENAMKKGPISANVLSKNAQNILNGDASALQRDVAYQKTQNEVTTATAAVKTTENAAKNALTTLQAANNNVSQTATLLDTIRAQMAELKQLQVEYNALVDKNSEGQMGQLRKQQADADERARSGIDTQRENVGKAGNIVKSGYSRQNQLQQERALEERQKHLAEQDQRESEQFVNNLKQATNRWMSMQQVVNLVKRGMRQAYQDIKALDTAMTNIAVVTDMSIQELWGKIDQYMSIAQQYGVTTQGVYEVSQLYYQQGLSTNEVMAATTETLKLARIAGMDYKDAADAMTVAIRSFKMEMDDAQRVTDVYSKVAAITASDSEELAVAMSKTASSAESVGSSFENTTAMLAVMVETTRESAQNLGSALKSIISRYGEMKAGKTTDEDGEAIYYNKVDQALASVGISLKDAQGQFRDFDDVIFELSKKWDSLDKNTQRYIATIMAGNRQQSRFIALVDNWERLDEVSQAAADSADAGLLQYAKTLDSLDTKLNSIKTSFQEFYMNIVNGPVIGGILEAINSLIQGFNKLGTFQGILNLVGIIRGLKVALKLVVNTFSHSFTSIIGSWKSVQTQLLTLARASGAERGREEANAEIQAYNATIQQGRVAGYKNAHVNNSTNPTTQIARRRSRIAEGAGEKASLKAYNEMSWFDKRQYGMQTGKVEWANNSWGGSKWGQITSIGGALAGGALQTWGASAAEDNARLGSVLSGLGNTFQGASIGSLAGPVGAIIGAVVGALASLPSIFKAFNPEQILKEKLENAEKVLQEAELERAQKKETARNLESTIENLKKLQEVRYESEEANQAFLDASSEAIEQFSELATEMDASGQLIVSINNEASNSEQLLYKARKEAADAALKAAAAESQKNKIRVQQTVEAFETYYEKTEKFNEGEGIASTNIFGAGEVEGITKFANSNYSFDGNISYYEEGEAPEINNPENFEKWEYALLQMMANSSLEQNEIVGGDEWFAFGEELFSVIKEMDDYFTSDMNNLEIMQAYIKLITDADSELITKLKEKAEGNEELFDFIDEDNDNKSLQARLIDYATAVLTTEGILGENETIYDFVDKESSLKAERSAAAAASEASDYAQVLSAFDTYLLQSDPYQQADWLAEFQAGKQLLYLALENTLVEQIDSIGEITDLIDSTGAIGDSYLPIVQNTMDEYYSSMTALYNENIGLIEDIRSILERSASGSINIEEAENQLEQLLNSEDGTNYDWFINAWKDSVITADNEIRAYYIKSLFDNDMPLEAETTVGDITFMADLSSYDAWRKSYEEATGKLLDDNAANREIYYNKLRTNLSEAMRAAGQFDEDFFNFIAYGPINILTEYQKIFYDDNKLITSGAAGSAVAQQRIEKIKKLYTQATNKTGSFSNLKDEDISKFFELMQNNYGTYDWAEDLEGWEEDYADLGIDFEELAYENYLVHIQNIINEASGINGSLEQLADKQNKGFSWEEAQNTLSLIQAIDPEKKWSDIFDVNSQGLIILKDFYDEANNLYTSSLKDLNQKQQELNDLLNINLASEKEFDFQGKGLQQGKKMLETTAKEYAQEIATAYGITDTRQIDAITSGIVQGQIYSYESLVEFFNSMKIQVDDAANVFQNQTHSLLASQAFTQYNTEKFEKSNSVKQLFDIGEYGDLQAFWQERMAAYSEAMASAWDQNKIDNLKDEEIKKLMWAFAVDTEEELQEKLLSITEGKTLEYEDYLSQFTIYDSQLSSAFGAQIDNYGQIIITNAEKWADFIATSQGFEKDSDEYRQILAEAKLQGKIALESYASSLEDGITEIATGLISDGEIEYSQLQDIIDTLQSRGVLEAAEYENLMNAYEALKSGTEGSYTAFLNQITQLAREAGLESFDTSEIRAAIRDVYAELISSLASALKDGVEGTLSNEDYTDLAKRYKLSGDLRTSKGVSLSTQSQQTMAVEMYRTAQASGSTLGVGEDIWAAFKDADDSILGTYEDINEEIERITEELNNWPDSENEAKKQAKDYLEVLKQIKDAARLDAESSIFNFMDQDWGGAGADTFDSFVGSVDKVKSALQSLKEGEYIDYKDFANMISFLNSSGQWDSFAANTEAAGMSYEEFVRSVVAHTDELGKVNLKGIATEMGVGVDAAMESMSGSMSEGLKKVAEEQIKYLKGLEGMLKAMVALEAMGELDLSISIDTNGDEVPDLTFQLYELSEIWKELSDPEKREVSKAVKFKIEGLQNNAAIQDLLASAGLEDFNFVEYLLGSDGEISGLQDINKIDLFGTLLDTLGKITPDQMQTAVRGFGQQFSDALNEEGNIKLEYFDDFLNYLMGLDYTTLAATVTDELSVALANQGGVFNVGSVKVDTTGGRVTLTGLSDNVEVREDQIAAVEAEASRLLNKGVTLQLDPESTNVGQFITTSSAEELASISTDFETLEEAAVAVETAFASLQNILDNFAVSEAFREFVSLVSSLRGGSAVIGGEGDGVAEGMGLDLQLDFSDALNEIETFKTTYETFKTTIENTPIAIRATSPSTINAPVVQGGESQTATVNQVTNVTQTITVTYVEENEKPQVVTPQEIEYSWKATNSVTQPSAKTVRFSWVATNPLTNWYTASNAIPVYFKWTQTGSTPTKPTSTSTPVENWTGTMNNISGAAYADGSIGRMYSGAELANKALVGELGPELAVYNGQYHMLGAHGAEFVKLPSDAIVFNHKQTEGILKGQFNIRGQALAEGNVTGPAYAGGASEALAQVQNAIAVWQSLINNLTVADLVGATSSGSGGGSGQSITAVTTELQEWYNLSRQIADIETEINNLIAERNNLSGGDSLRNLREQEALLRRQAEVQKVLLDYQQLQLKRQQEHILNNSIWSQFLTFDDNGNLQYIKGNEGTGQKGALEVLADLNEMSGEEQTAFLKRLGYSYTDADGKVYEGSELVKKFQEELQAQFTSYDSLYDAVHETEGTLSDIESKINDIDQTIIDNQLNVEQLIYDTLVEAIEREIDALEEQKDLLEEANKNYIDGLKNALSDEQKMYSTNQNIADRESLQRRIALLRRSGGSANEIYELEKQLDSMLQSEYFNRQEELIQNISDANDEQVRRLEEQIELQKESLEYQQEHGILWAQVYDVLSGSTEQILDFLSGNNQAFFESSLLQQKQMLHEWFDEVDFYKEEQRYQEHKSFAETNLWDTGTALRQLDSTTQASYNSLSDSDKESVKQAFLSDYATARLKEGADHSSALEEALNNMKKTIQQKKEASESSNNSAPSSSTGGTGSGSSSSTESSGSSGSSSSGSTSGSSSSSSSSYSQVSITVTSSNSSQGSPTPTSATVKPGQTFTVKPNPKPGYEFSHIVYNNATKYSTSITPTGRVARIPIVVYYKATSGGSSNSSNTTENNTSTTSGGNWGYTITQNGTKITNKSTMAKYGMTENPKTGFATREQAQAAAQAIVRNIPGGKYTTKAYRQGGLVDYTGAALVHGTPSKPEAFLNAEQTAQITEALKAPKEQNIKKALSTIDKALNMWETVKEADKATQAKEEIWSRSLEHTLMAVNSAQDTFRSLMSNTINDSQNSNFTIAPGAITINVAELADSYDVEELSKDIMNRMVSIASKATNRGVNRR